VSQLDDLRTACITRLDQQRQRATRYQDYYDGEADVPVLMNTAERQTFRRFLRESGANWAELVVNAVAERLGVEGFRFGAGSDAAWLIWQASHMDADSQLVQTDALVTSSGYVLVQPDEANPTGVSITAESPMEATVIYEPGNRRRRAAGFKQFTDALGQTTDVLILPDAIVTWLPLTGVPDVAPNPAGVVGLIEVVPQPRTSRPPRSELQSVTSIVDRIHTTIFNRLVGTDFSAFRQIWATGVKMQREVIGRNEDGTEVTKLRRPYDIGADRLLVNENPDGRFGALAGDPLSGYLAAVEQDIHQLAAITQTPPHYLLGSMVNLSADAIRAAEAGLVAKVSRRALFIGEAWEEVMRIALGLIGSPAAADVEAEVIWHDFETRSEGQRVDALVKMRTLGVPTEVLWQKWGATPQEIDRWRELAAREAPAIEPATPPAA
jgi:hypothetical protein